MSCTFASPPRCLASFKLIPTELPEKLDDDFTTTYQLGCPCGCSLGRVRGYPLSHYNSDFWGDGFINPIAFECSFQYYLSPLNFVVRLKFVLNTARVHTRSLERSQNAKSEYRFNPNLLPKSLSDS